MARTIRSIAVQAPALEEAGARLDVTVVCHNLPADALSIALGDEVAGLARFIEFNDGIYSPAGPKNHALRQSRADYLTFVDSDDLLERGALLEWLATARRTGAAAVLAPIRTPEGSILTTPRIRPSKPPVLDPLRDGLATRSLPHGLLRRSDLELIRFRFTEGLRIGEDLEPTLRLLFSGVVIAYPYGSPAYRQTDDAGAGRVTSSVGRLGEEFAWVAPLIEQSWLRDAPLSHRRAIALKLMRIHGIGALRRRGAPASREVAAAGSNGSVSPPVWDAVEQAAWIAFHSAVLELAGKDLGALSRRDFVLARDAGRTADSDDLSRAVTRYSRSGRWGKLISADPLAVVRRDSVLRHYLDERRRRFRGVFTSPPPDPII